MYLSTYFSKLYENRSESEAETGWLTVVDHKLARIIVEMTHTVLMFECNENFIELLILPLIPSMKNSICVWFFKNILEQDSKVWLW